MLYFKYVEARNFLSVGNEFTRLVFKKGINLVLGKNYQELSEDGDPVSNGAGKSLMTVEALLFCLFGKTFKKIKKNSFVNKINKKNCVVRVELSNDGTNYVIERGVLPTYFKFKRNDEDWIEMSSTKLTQELLEQELNISYLSFTNRIVFNITKYNSFFTRPAADKRSSLEDLMNMGFYGDIFEGKKQEFNAANTEYKNIKNIVDHEELKNKELELENKRIDLDRKDWELDRAKRLSDEKIKLSGIEEELLLSKVFGGDNDEVDDELASRMTELKKMIQGLTSVHDAYIEFMSTLKSNITELESVDSFQISKDIMTAQGELSMLFSFMTDSEYTLKTTELNIQREKLINEIHILSDKISDCQADKRTIESVISHFKDGICPTCKQEVKNVDFKSNSDKIEILNIRIERLILIKDRKITEQQALDEEIALLKLDKEKESLIEEKRKIINEKIKKYEIILAKKDKLDLLKNKLTGLEEKYVKLNKELDMTNAKLLDIQSTINENKHNKEIFKYKTEMSEKIKQIIQNIENEKNPHNYIPLLKIDFKKLKLAELMYEKAKLVRDVWSEDGIRRSLVSNFIEYIDIKINKYISILGPSNTRIKFDSKFDETFYVGANEYEYENFSAGQMKKIDLAFLLMTYDLVSKTNLLNTNIVVFDEIIDSSIDTYGATVFLKLIKEKLKDKYIYIITHKNDIKESDVIDRIYTISLDLFSTLEIEENVQT